MSVPFNIPYADDHTKVSDFFIRIEIHTPLDPWLRSGPRANPRGHRLWISILEIPVLKPIFISFINVLPL